MKQTSINLAPLPGGDKIEQLIIVLQDYIINGDLVPGTRLPAERELAAKLRVSRFSLREALRAAQAKGLIEIARGKRPTIAKLSSDAAADVISLNLRRSGKSLLELVEARLSLECNIARFAAVRAEPTHIEAMRQTILYLKNNRKNLKLCIEKDMDFHSILVKASGNRVFEIMLSPLAELLRKSRTQTMRLNGVDRAIIGHEAILAAIVEKNVDKAGDAMYHHLMMAEEDLKKIEGDHDE